MKHANANVAFYSLHYLQCVPAVPGASMLTFANADSILRKPFLFRRYSEYSDVCWDVAGRLNSSGRSAGLQFPPDSPDVLIV